MVKNSNKNFWKWRKNSLLVAFIDKKAATSGALLKSMEFQAPEIMKEAKEKCAKGDFCLGHSFIIDHYLFIIGRNSYHTAYNTLTIQMILKSVFAQLNNQNKYEQIVPCEQLSFSAESSFSLNTL